jgi:ABC-2 type transport system permease protein
MKKTLLVAKLEMQIYSASPIVYIIGMVFLTISGYLYSDFLASFGMVSFRAINLDKMLGNQNISANSLVFVPLFSYMGFFLMLVIPLMTMRLFAEEKKAGTIELLFTYPVSDWEIIGGKLLASGIVLLLMLSSTLLYPILTAFFGTVIFGPIWAGYLGLFLQGMAFMSLGLFTSSLTENQIIAAILAYGGIVIFSSIRWSISYAPNLLGKVLEYLSISTHSSALIQGVIDTRDVVYYVLFFVFFGWLTLKSLESKKWRK